MKVTGTDDAIEAMAAARYIPSAATKNAPRTIRADAGRVNKYEAGRMAPAAETLVRLAEVLNVSIDYLLIDEVPRRPLHSAEDALGDRLTAVAELGEEDLRLVLSFVDALVAKTRLKALAGGIG